MDTQKETKELITPVKNHKVIMYTYFDGYDIREINKIGREEKDKNLAMEKGEDVMIELLIVSIDGNKENIIENLCRMKGKDYKFVMDEVNRIVKEDFLDQAENISKEG